MAREAKRKTHTAITGETGTIEICMENFKHLVCNMQVSGGTCDVNCYGGVVADGTNTYGLTDPATNDYDELSGTAVTGSSKQNWRFFNVVYDYIKLAFANNTGSIVIKSTLKDEYER